MDEQVKGVYPVKMLVDENGQAFVPLTSWDAVEGSKDLQYIFEATETSSGHFKIEHEKILEKALIGAVIIVQWPTISSAVKPSYLQFNDADEKPLYNGNGTEYLDLEESSNTINMFAYDGNKWILSSGAGSGSGHVITDDKGNTLEQQKILNFVGFNVENDTVNRATKIINPTPINNLTTSQSGQGSLDAYQGYVLSTKMVPTGGQKGQVLAKSGNEDHQLEWINKDGDDVIKSDGSIEEIIGLTYEEYKALDAAGQLKPTTQYHIIDMTDGEISFVSTGDIQTMIDDSIEDSTKPVYIQENTDLNTVVTPGYYISEKTAITSTLQNTPPGLTIGFALYVTQDAGLGVSNYHQTAIRDEKIFTRSTNDGGASWTSWQIIMGYRVGDVFITSTNTNPGATLGGTWQLIKKDFSYKYVSEVDVEAGMFVPNKDVVSGYDLRFARQGDCFKIRLYISLAVDVDDNTVVLGTFDCSQIGIEYIRFAMFGLPLMCDGGNGLLNCYFHTSGALEARDIMNKYANTVMTAGSTGYLSCSIACTDDEKLDSACDQFHWRRIA